jgi:hypothetical protein
MSWRLSALAMSFLGRFALSPSVPSLEGTKLQHSFMATLLALETLGTQFCCGEN